MSGPADRVLPLIRTRADVYRWAAANDHGQRMLAALDILEAALLAADPVEAYAVTHKVLGSAIKVIACATRWPSFPFCSTSWRTNWWWPRPKTTASGRDGWPRCAN